MPMHNFSLVGEVFLYFILRVEVIEIQIVKRFEKKKEFSHLMGQNLARSGISPAHPPVIFLCTAQLS
jgi:hypothetical protein